MFYRFYRLQDELEIHYSCSENEVISDFYAVPINLNRLHEFMINIEKGKPDAIRTILINLHGYPRIYHLFYDGEKILAVYDPTHTRGTEKISIYEGDSIDIIGVEDRDRIEYVLMKDDNPVQRIYSYSERFMKRRMN